MKKKSNPHTSQALNSSHLQKNKAPANTNLVNPQKPRTSHKYSIVSAVYNVEKYLDQYISSVVNQSVETNDQIELILVDDGSIDGSANIIKSWQKKYPRTIKYIYQDNGGQGAARNKGLLYARHEWISFIDPDDFISDNYFSEIDKSITVSNNSVSLKLVCANYIFYHEDVDQYSDTHPLNFRFSKGDCLLPINDMGKHIILNVNCVFFKRIRLIERDMRFDTRIRPAFEDGHFVNKYLLSLDDGHVAYLHKPKYFYRKRQDGSSTLDTGWSHPGRYKEQLKLGYLGLIEESIKQYGHVKPCIQRTILYDLSWHFKRFINHPERLAGLTKEQRHEYESLIREIMTFISMETLLSFELAGMWFYQKLGLLSYYKDFQPDFTIVYFDEWDELKDLVKIKYFAPSNSYREALTIDGRTLIPEYSTTRTHKLFDKQFTFERIIWLRLGDAKTLNFQIANLSTRFSLRGKQYRNGVPVKDIHRVLSSRAIDLAEIPGDVAEVRLAARAARNVVKYGNCWLLMDRDTQADDNAEHLYRYIRDNHKHITIYFVLSDTAQDWHRLAKNDFNLIPFGSLDHKIALLNASHLISSHADHYVFGNLEKKWYSDLTSYKYTFLQHGVIKDDLSSWLNLKNIDCLITTTKREYESIVNDGGYKFTDREVALTGLARHDKLRNFGRDEARAILVMPTWRNTLVGAATGKTNVRDINPEFAKTSYFRAWQEFILSEKLKEIANHHNYSIVFFPHANIQPYIDMFEVPEHITIQLHNGEDSIQPLLAQAAILVTDYSSIAFETATLRIPVVYYQFDSSEVFSGAHIYQQGYFDYEKDGFGPVTFTQDSAIYEIEKIAIKSAIPEQRFLQRMNEAFYFEDENSCQRIFASIDQLNQSSLQPDATAPAAIEFANRAIRNFQTEQAIISCKKVIDGQSNSFYKALAGYQYSIASIQKNELIEAQDWLEYAKSHGLSDREYKYQNLRLAIENRNFNFIEPHIVDALNSIPLDIDPELIALISRALRVQNRYDEADTLLSGMETGHNYILAEKAEMATHHGHFEEALHLRKTISKTTSGDYEYLAIAKLLRRLRRIPEAEVFIKLVSVDCKINDYHLEYAEIAYAASKWQIAEKHWALMTTEALSPDALLKLAKTLRKLGRHKQAEQILLLANSASDERTYLQEKALILNILGQWEQALEAWKVFISRKDLHPNRDAWLHQAQTRISLSQYKQALRDIERFESFGTVTPKSESLRLIVNKNLTTPVASI